MNKDRWDRWAEAITIWYGTAMVLLFLIVCTASAIDGSYRCTFTFNHFGVGEWVADMVCFSILGIAGVWASGRAVKRFRKK